MSHHDDENESVPLIQQLLDSPFLLLFLGVMAAAAMALLSLLPAVEAVITAFDFGAVAR